ncbi:MAG: hypothetical protein ACTHN0_09275 [Aquihabitans sp.]
MTYRNVLLVVHIAAAAAWLGANLVQLALTPQFAKRGGEAAASWFEATSWLGKRYYNLAGIVLALTGILLVQETAYDWSAGFVAVGIVVIVIGAVMGVAFFAPEGDRLAAASRAGEPVASSRYLAFALLDTALVVLAISAMVWKWHA